jgi:hypothetical protein
MGSAIAAVGWGLGQFVRTGEWLGDVGLVIDHETRSTETVERPLEIRRSTYRTGIGVRNSSLVFGPRLMVGSVGAQFSLNQERFANQNRSSSGSGRLEGYDLGMTFRPDRNFSFGFSSLSNRTTLPRLFGTSREQLYTSHGAQARLAVAGFDSTVRWSSSRTETQADGVRQQERDGEERTILEFLGAHKAERQTVSIEHRRERRDDLVLPQLSFPLYITRLRHRLDLDPTIDQRSLLTSVSLNRRGGELQRDQLRGETRLDFRLRPTLDTRATLQVEQIDSADFSRDRRTLDLRAKHRLYESLQTTIAVKRTRESLDSSDRQLTGSNLLLEYRKKLPARGRLTSTIGRRWERDKSRVDRRTDAALGEPHEARIAAPFRLEQTGVLIGSIVVTDATGTIIYREGIDYSITSVGEAVEINILTAGRIVDGQTLLVDYRFEVPPFTRASEAQSRLEVLVDYNWIFGYYRLNDMARDHVDGFDDDSSVHRTSRLAGLGLRFGRGPVRAQLRNERLSENDRSLEFESLRFEQMLTFAPRPGLTLTAVANEAQTDFVIPARRETRGSAGADLWWRATPFVSLRATATLRWREDDLGFDERFSQLAIDARWTRRVCNLSIGISRDWGERDGRRSDGLRFNLNLTRPF